MTNEEIAAAIKQGGADDLIPVLWERTKRFIFRECKSMYDRQPDTFAAHGITLDNLKQESYYAFLAAIRGYTADNGFSFLAYLHYPLLKMRSRLLRLYGLATDTLAQSVSLNLPVKDENKEIGELIELVEDNGESPEQVLEQKSIRDIVNAAVDRLSENERLVIRAFFYDNKSLVDVAEHLHVNRQRAAQIKDRALDKLRHNPEIIRLRDVFQDT